MKKNKKIIDLSQIKTSQIEEELKRENYRLKYKQLLRNTVYTLIIIAAFCVLLATLVMPVLEIKGNSMAPKYKNGDVTLAVKTKNIKRGDIIAFYFGNKILVKRVIATQGDWVDIKEDGTIKVNNEVIQKPYASYKILDTGDIKYPYQVPDGQLFVLSDNKDDLQDSRLKQIGSIKQDDVIGKTLFKIWSLN